MRISRRRVHHGDTPAFLSPLEGVAVLTRRLAQVNDHHGADAAIAEAVVKRLGEGAGLYQLLLAELADRDVEYPVLVLRGHGPDAAECRLHTDLVVDPAVVDYFVLADEAGQISYDTVAEDMRRPSAPDMAAERTIQLVQAALSGVAAPRL